MEHYKISKLFKINFTKIQLYQNLWQKNGKYSVNESIRFKNSISRSNLCDYSDAYIVVKETISVEGDDDDKKRDKNTPLGTILHLDHAFQKSIIHL